MYCRYCGKEIPEDSVYCTYCGNAQNGQKSSQSFHINVGQTDQGIGQLPMNWYNFQIYVGLFLAVIAYAYRGISLILVFNQSYFSFMAGSGVAALNIVMGIAQIILAVYSFSVRQKLTHFKADGPKSLLILYVLSCIATAVYTGLLLILFDQGILILSSVIPSCGVSAIMIYVNKVYFEKRMHLFVN